VLALAEHMRLHPIVRGVQEPYRYEREVEDFLRWSPHVRNPAYRAHTGLTEQEQTELGRLHGAYGERVGAPEAASPAAQADALARAARAPNCAGRDPRRAKMRI